MKPWKAIYAAVVAGLGSLLVAVQSENGVGGDITAPEGVTVAIATVTAFGGTYFVDNNWGE